MSYLGDAKRWGSAVHRILERPYHSHGQQAPQLLEKLSSLLIDLLPQTKPSTVPTAESIATQLQHLDFFSDKAAEFIHLNGGSGLRLWLIDW